jgi:glycerol 2-dehydrogenase (NADP+)
MFPLLPDGKRDVDRSWKLADTWRQMEGVVKKGTLSRYEKKKDYLTHLVTSHTTAGKVRSIGVSNFSELMLEEILPTAEIVPAVDQVSFPFSFG